MTSKLTREQIRERAKLKAKNLAGAISQSAFANCRGELEEELQFLQCALACMEDEPVEPIWGAKKYPVSRPVPGSRLIVWDETGQFVGYGHAVNTRESGVAIQMSDGRWFDSNHDLRWQYALQPLPVVDSEPVAWTDEEELRDVNVAGIGYLFGIDREANKFAGPRRQIMLYRHAQPAPVVTFYRDGIEAAAKWIDQQREAYDSEHGRHDLDTGSFEFGNDAQREYSSTLEELAEGIRALHPNAGNSPAIPEGYVMVPMRITAENGAKGVLSGEFSETQFVNCPECFGDDECETCDGSGRIEIKVPVSWTTIKEIWIKGVEYFAAAPQENN